MKTNQTLCFSLFLAIIMFFSCSKGPKPIDYGKDTCHFCRMTIVDKIHGAELITDKGKVFKFDAVECLIRYINDLETIEDYQLLTNYFENPESLISMEDATYLISENLPSPMGAYLTAFETEVKAADLREEKGGVLYNWKSLREEFRD